MPKVIASAPNAGGRHQRGRRVGPTLAEINVIPLVDVMLVLLIIFMVAAPMLQRGVEVALPVASRAQDIASERIFVDVPMSFSKDRRVFLGKESVTLEVLPERVRQIMVNRNDKQVFLRIDGRLNVQHQMDVFDELKAGGVRDVGIVTDAPTRAR
jgi:biopolymer transport protein TolR